MCLHFKKNFQLNFKVLTIITTATNKTSSHFITNFAEHPRLTKLKQHLLPIYSYIFPPMYKIRIYVKYIFYIGKKKKIYFSIVKTYKTIILGKCYFNVKLENLYLMSFLLCWCNMLVICYGVMYGVLEKSSKKKKVSLSACALDRFHKWVLKIHHWYSLIINNIWVDSCFICIFSWLYQHWALDRKVAFFLCVVRCI